MMRDEEFEKRKEQLWEELKANSQIQAYLSQYEPRSAESFLKDYASRKALWYHYSELHIKQNEREDLQWVEAGFVHLERIQQKKLFNLQCEWRAEKITLPGIEICEDFKH